MLKARLSKESSCGPTQAMANLIQHPTFNASKLGKTFGYVPDPPRQRSEQPDAKFEATTLKLKAPGPYVDLRPYTTETNQSKASSCVGNATADSVEIVNAIEGRPRVELSRLFVYSMCRALQDIDRDGKGDVNHDEGTWVRLAFYVIQTFGVCTEAIWPYDLKKNLYRLPSLLAMREATGHRIHSYYRINSSGQGRLDLIIDALKAHHPVVFGTQVTDSFIQLRGKGPVDRPKGDTFVGGHAMVIVGYQPEGFIVKNSWGKGWGENGFCIMRPEYLSWKQSSDFWVPTLGTTFR